MEGGPLLDETGSSEGFFSAGIVSRAQALLLLVSSPSHPAVDLAVKKTEAVSLLEVIVTDGSKPFSCPTPSPNPNQVLALIPSLNTNLKPYPRASQA